jgi:predicted metal-dependent HD superfamily phosphohydrolase
MAQPISPEPTSDQALRNRWNRDVRAGVTAATAPDPTNAGVALISRWREPHRRYHTVMHLVAVLDGIEELAAQADDVRVVRLGAWFHDAVYQGRPGADEEASAQLAERVLPDLGWPQDRVTEVARLIRLTADHAGINDGDRNGAVLADADLAVLASAEPDYRAYTRAVRAEYAHVPDPEFIAGRSQILSRLLESGPLYRTEEARTRWSAAAEHNLRSELAELARLAEHGAR